jgi:hypothetical protein
VSKYLSREQTFKSTLVRPRQPSFEEGSLFDKRLGIERTIFSLFPRGDSAKVGAQYAMDADLVYEWEGASEPPLVEAKAIDRMLADVPGHWLAPYLNLIAGHRRLCAVQMDGPEPKSERDSWARDARRQLTLARNAGHPLIRIVADHLLATGRCVDE